MSQTVALFHSVLGIREGIAEAAARLRGNGHDVVVVDQYDGRTFDDYEEAAAFANSIGFPTLMNRALDGSHSYPMVSSRWGSPTARAWPPSSQLRNRRL